MMMMMMMMMMMIVMILALANISVLRNWCFLHLHTRTWHVTSLVWVGWVGGGDVNVRCTCTHLGATQLMFLALANISVLRNWCFLHLHTRTWHVTSLVWVGWVGGGDVNVRCTCTHLGATQLMFLALANISVLRNWCFLHLHTRTWHVTSLVWVGWVGGGGC